MSKCRICGSKNCPIDVTNVTAFDADEYYATINQEAPESHRGAWTVVVRIVLVLVAAWMIAWTVGVML